MRVIRDKPTIITTVTTVGVWNSNILFLAATIPIKFNFVASLAEGVNNFAFIIGT